MNTLQAPHARWAGSARRPGAGVRQGVAAGSPRPPSRPLYVRHRKRPPRAGWGCRTTRGRPGWPRHPGRSRARRAPPTAPVMTAPHIYEFTVEELAEGGLRAVHHADASLVVAAESWQDLGRDCMVAWLLRTWRLADEQRDRDSRAARS